MRPYVDILWRREVTEVPVVLPRRQEKNGALTAYVIAHDRAHAVVVAELLTAFVGPSFSRFDGLPARLDPDDPVEQAVREFVGDGLTFKVSSPTKQSQAAAWRVSGPVARDGAATPGPDLACPQAYRAVDRRVRGGAGRGRQLRIGGSA